MAFRIEKADPGSSYTLMGREQWFEACRYYLNGVFQYIPDLDAPVLVKRTEWEKTYPNERTPEWKKYAERFEGLARTFLMAAPLIKEYPEEEILGIKLRQYYKKQILEGCSPGESAYLLSYQDLRKMQPEGTFQHTVECAALVMGLWICEETIWNDYTQSEKDRIADFLFSFAYGDTEPHNWRLFNMLILAFLYRAGYRVDEEFMRMHARAVASFYAGDGWYRDGHAFDYYSAWAFQTYLPLWNLWYGYEKEPELAQAFQEHSRKLMENYPWFFDRNGGVKMWGRSNIYRNAATSCLAAHFFLRETNLDPGWARRICSGALLQFITRDDVFCEGVPSLGFYGQFMPMVQEYSCAESPFWISKAMLCLALPADHPFWTAKENEGGWERLNGVNTLFLDGPGMALSAHPENGASQLRTGKIMREAGDLGGLMGYGRLCFCADHPWEAFGEKGPESQLYVPDSREYGNFILYAGHEGDVLYRRMYFGFRGSMKNSNCIDLADLATDYGILRVDRIRRQTPLTLGGWSIAGKDLRIEERTKGQARAFILTCGKESVAMTVFHGFSELLIEEREGTSPLGGQSFLPYGKHTGPEYTLISLSQFRKDGKPWREEELFPVEEIRMERDMGPVTITLADGRCVHVDYEGIEGRLTL